MLRPKRNRSVQIIRGTFHKFCGHLYCGKTGNGLFGARGACQFDVGNIVKVKLLDFTNEIWNGGCHADFFFKMIKATKMDGAPLKGVVFALGFR